MGLNTFLNVIEIPKPKKNFLAVCILEYSADIRYIRETSRIRLNETNLLVLPTEKDHRLFEQDNKCYTYLFSSPEAALLLVSSKNRELWEGLIF